MPCMKPFPTQRARSSVILLVTGSRLMACATLVGMTLQAGRRTSVKVPLRIFASRSFLYASFQSSRCGPLSASSVDVGSMTSWYSSISVLKQMGPSPPCSVTGTEPCDGPMSSTVDCAIWRANAIWAAVLRRDLVLFDGGPSSRAALSGRTG